MKEIYDKIKHIYDNGGKAVLITVISKEGGGPAIAGTKLLITEEEKIGTVGGGTIEYLAIEKAKNILKSENYKNETISYDLNANSEIITESEKTGMICGGYISLFYEYITSGQKLYIFGAGHIGKAVYYYLKNLEYDITIIDQRKEMFDDFEGNFKKEVYDYLQYLNEKLIEENSIVLIATHTHDLDYKILKKLYEKKLKLKYIGALASKTKALSFKENLKKDLGYEPDYSNLYMPVGIKTGGTKPYDIAISIVAQIQLIKYNL